MQTRRIARFRPRRHLIQRKAPARRMPNGGEKCRSTKLALLRPFPRTRNPGRPTTAAKPMEAKVASLKRETWSAATAGRISATVAA